MEPSQTYLVTVKVEGFQETPYNVVEFTTTPFDFAESSNMEGDIHVTEIGFIAKIETDGTAFSDLTYYKYFLVDREDDAFKVELSSNQKGKTLMFEIPEASLPDSDILQKKFKLQYGKNINEIKTLESVFGDYYQPFFITVYRPEAYIGYRLDSGVIGDQCPLITFQANFYGLFYWFRAEGYDEERINLIIRNLDTDSELILSNPENDLQACNRFYFGNQGDFEWKGLIPQVMYVQFVEDESLGLIAGNYSAKVTYELADGFHESNTFEFVIEE